MATLRLGKDDSRRAAGAESRARTGAIRPRDGAADWQIRQRKTRPGGTIPGAER
jgi:hypothetical protein